MFVYTALLIHMQSCDRGKAENYLSKDLIKDQSDSSAVTKIFLT